MLDWIVDPNAWVALAFLILIGVTLRAEGLDFHIPNGYIYTSMTFPFLVEMLNLRRRRSEPPLELREPYAVPDGTRGVPVPESIQWPVPLSRPRA